MPGRLTPLVNGEYYHIFNRGVARQPTFLNKNDYKQALLALSYYCYINPPIRLSKFKETSREEQNRISVNMKQQPRHIELIAFVLMTNHFHFLLRQVSDNGISSFLSKFTNSYAKYFNIKYKRVGPLFQGRFKSIHVESDDQLLHLSRYIHLNPVVSSLILEKELLSYPWSSFPDYLTGQSDLITVDPILKNFKTNNDYKQFVFDNIDYGKKLEHIKHLTLE